MAATIQTARCTRLRARFLFLVLLTALTLGRVAAQSEPTPPADRADERAEQIEEITVLGQRSLRALRLEVQAARERVYDLFNSLNSNDEFDITCQNVPMTGTRIPQRVCRPQFAGNATSTAASGFLRALLFECSINQPDYEACVQRNTSAAQATVSVVPLKDRQLASEVQRLAREHRGFRRAMTEYQALERGYEDARRAEGPALQASASIIDTVRAAMPARRAPEQDAIVTPAPVDLVTPAVLSSGLAADGLREGWVKLRYSILTNGMTADVRVVDAVPPDLDPSSAMAAVQAWTFEPATADGVPIDWHNNLAVVVFNRAQAVHERWLDFAEAYEEVAELISSARYEDAKSRNERMQQRFSVTLDEISLASMQLAAIEHALGNPHAALVAIRRATEPAIPQLADEELSVALELRFALEVQLGRAVDALETYERLAALTRLRSRDPIARQGEALRQALRAPEASLGIQGRIDANGWWEHSLTYRTFAVGDMDGRNESLEVECNRNKAELPFDADVEISVPPAWGECVLFVTGQPGTTFTLYEFSEPIDR